MSESLPAMRLWVSDFCGSARIATLTWLERGLYLTMLTREWQFKGMGLPGGEELVELLKGPGKCSAADSKTLRRAIAKLLQTFFIEIDGRWFNERLEDELKLILDEKKARSEAGKNGAAKRWGGHWQPSPSPDGLCKQPSSSSPPGDGDGVLKTEPGDGSESPPKNSSKFLGLRLKIGDLDKPRRLLEIADTAALLGLVNPGDGGKVRVLALAEAVKRSPKTKNSYKLFYYRLVNKIFSDITDADENRAAEKLKRARM